MAGPIFRIGLRRKGLERPLRSVPAWMFAALAAGIAAQIGWSAHLPAAQARAADLPAAPSAHALGLAALGEPVALGKALMLWLQAFDYQSGSRVPYRDLDYPRLVEWLERILTLDPRGQYPLLSAARLYAEVPDPARARLMLDLIHRRYLEDPNRRWPWLAHAAVLAKHRLGDLPLARRYAVALQENTTATDVPLWVTQMEAFILEDMNELEAAKILIGGMLQQGKIRDRRDAQLLERRLKMLEEKLSRKPPSSH